MSAFAIALSACIILLGIVVFLFLSISNIPPKPSKTLRIAKTIIPLEYTGKDYQKWIEQIKIERQILSIKNDNDFMLNLMLKSKLSNENIFSKTK